MLERNEVAGDDIVSAFFTVTDDCAPRSRPRPRGGWGSGASR
jgi:hypothetical protein